MAGKKDEMTELHTIRDVIRWAATRFAEAGLHFGHGTDNAIDDAAHLVLDTLRLPLDLPETWLDSRLTATERDAVAGRIDERIRTRRPTAYLTGEAWFASVPFTVDERVLIPRSPIAELIEAGFPPWFDEWTPERILDVGTGSGCIGIACALRFPMAEVDLIDISEDALDVARINIERHEVADRVRCLKSDGLAAVTELRYDLIVSNPPYVGEEEFSDLPEEFGHEPELALLSEDDGLAFTMKLLSDAPSRLNDDGLLVVELGNTARLLESRYPDIPVSWLEFERGGGGVFAIDRGSLVAWLELHDGQETG